MNKTKREKIFELLRQSNPKPTTELSYRSNYQLLIAVILLVMLLLLMLLCGLGLYSGLALL